MPGRNCPSDQTVWKIPSVHQRWACDKHLRHAIYLFAEQSLSRCVWAELYYRHHAACSDLRTAKRIAAMLMPYGDSAIAGSKSFTECGSTGPLIMPNFIIVTNSNMAPGSSSSDHPDNQIFPSRPIESLSGQTITRIVPRVSNAKPDLPWKGNRTGVPDLTNVIDRIAQCT